MKGKQNKKQNSQPQTHYIASSQSISWHWQHPKMTESSHHKKDFCTGIPSQAQTKACRKSHGFRKVSTLKSLSPSFESLGGSRPSLIIDLLSFFKRSIFTSSTLLLRGICFPKYIAPNVTISEKHRLL